jgi:hypothetical protein
MRLGFESQAGNAADADYLNYSNQRETKATILLNQG